MLRRALLAGTMALPSNIQMGAPLMEGWFAALCALLGAVVGAGSVGFVTWITQRQETRRRVAAAMIDGGMKEWAEHFGRLPKTPARSVLPPWAYAIAMAQHAEAIEKSGGLTDAEMRKLIEKIFKRQELINAECRRLDQESRRAHAADGGSSANMRSM